MRIERVDGGAAQPTALPRSVVPSVMFDVDELGNAGHARRRSAVEQRTDVMGHDGAGTNAPHHADQSRHQTGANPVRLAERLEPSGNVLQPRPRGQKIAGIAFETDDVLTAAQVARELEDERLQTAWRHSLNDMKGSS